MKREIITTDSYGRITIPSDTGNIWMNEMELVELFGVIAPTLRAAIRAVYKCGVLNPLEAEKRIRLPNGYYAERRKTGHAKRKCSINGWLFQVKGDKKARSRGICTSSGTGCCR